MVVVRPGMIQSAILRAMKRKQWTMYRLWQEANRANPLVTKSQVYEYLSGQRDVSATIVESMMEVLNLRVEQQLPDALA